MRAVVQNFLDELDKRHLSHRNIEEFNGRTVVPLGFELSNLRTKIYVFFDENDRSVAIRCFGFMKVSENQFPQALMCCNSLNKSMRWVKFYVDTDMEIHAEDDAIVDEETAGVEILELVMQMAKIVDEAYPQINRAIWS